MKTKKARPTASAIAGGRRPSASPAPDAPGPALGPGLDGQAVADFLARSAEEIHSHLALAAEVKSKMSGLLGATIEELERARRLETLAASIAAAVPGSPETRSHPGPASPKTARPPESYFKEEIRTLKKARKLLGIRESRPAPRSSPSPPAPPPPPRTKPSPFPPIEATSPPGPRRTVLLLEDDPFTVRLLKYFLETEGLRVLVSADGPEGFRTAVRERPDLIILDLMVPGIDGYQLLKDLKDDPSTAPLPVFVLSILAQETDILKAIELGASDYFSKPFSPPVLIAKVKRALEARRG